MKVNWIGHKNNNKYLSLKHKFKTQAVSGVREGSEVRGTENIEITTSNQNETTSVYYMYIQGTCRNKTKQEYS